MYDYYYYYYYYYHYYYYYYYYCCLTSGVCRWTSSLTSHDIQTLVMSHSVDTVLNDTSLLHSVDLHQLTTNEQRLCFYGNLLNLMMLHAVIVCTTARLIQVSVHSFIHGTRPTQPSLPPSVVG